MRVEGYSRKKFSRQDIWVPRDHVLVHENERVEKSLVLMAVKRDKDVVYRPKLVSRRRSETDRGPWMSFRPREITIDTF